MQAPDEIRVDGARIEALRTQFERVWQRPPTPAELEGLIDNWVREEMLYREGLALGFEADDPVVRRRIVQKVTFMTEALLDETTTDEQLAEWLQQHPDQYRIDPHISLRQVYFDPARHESALEASLAAALAELEADPQANPATRACFRARSRTDRKPTSSEASGATSPPRFSSCRSAQWSGARRQASACTSCGSTSSCRDVRRRSTKFGTPWRRDLVATRRREAADAMYEALRERYTVVMEDTDVPAAAGAP